MNFILLSLLSLAVAGRTTSPAPLGAQTPASTLAAASPVQGHVPVTQQAAPPGPSPWFYKLKNYFQNGFSGQKNENQQFLGDSFDRYLTSAVIQYKFSTPEDLSAFRDATATLVVDTWFIDMEYGVVCLAASQIDTFDRLLPAKLRDTKSVTDADVHRTLIKTFPLHPVELPSVDFANASEIQRYLQTFPNTDLGHSWEGRPITAVLAHAQATTTIAALPAEETKSELSTLYICGIHGREWASTSACLGLLDTLVPGESVIPLANPDGYHNSFTSDRLWSKNMQPTSLSFCPGHDIARGLMGTYELDATQCSVSYCGQKSDAPLEVRAINEYASRFKRVIYVQGTERTPESRVHEIDSKKFRISLPDFGSSFLISRNHINAAVSSVKNAIDSLGTQKG